MTNETDQPTNVGSNDLLGRLLPEPLFRLHTGELFGSERDEWEVVVNSSEVVDKLAEAQPLGANLGLYDEHTVRALLAAEKARLIKLVVGRAQSHNGPHLVTLELNQLAAWMAGKDWFGIGPPKA